MLARRTLSRCWLFCFLLLSFAPTGLTAVRAEQAQAELYEVSTWPATTFRIGSRQTRFGPLEFIGGLEMTSRGRHFGGLSSFRFLDSGRRFVGVTDTGFWFFGSLSRDAEGRPSGIADFSMEAMQDSNGGIRNDKWYVDAESVAIDGGRVTVGFERAHRIAEFHLRPGNMGPPTGKLDFLVPANELRTNGGFETLAHAPGDSALAGARVAVAERSIDASGNNFAAILEGPLKGVFTIARSDDFDITDGAFLPDGDILLLERRFTFITGVAMRIRRIVADSIRPGNVADGPVLLVADMGYQIDNMEALDVWRREDGAIMISLLSDDNHSILQSNLYLEFRLHQN